MHTIEDNTDPNQREEDQYLPRPFPVATEEGRDSDNLALAFLLTKGGICTVQRSAGEHPDRKEYMSLTFFLSLMDAVRVHTLYSRWLYADTEREVRLRMLKRLAREWKPIRDHIRHLDLFEDPIWKTYHSFPGSISLPEGHTIINPEMQVGFTSTWGNPGGIWIPSRSAEIGLRLFRGQIHASLPDAMEDLGLFPVDPEISLSELLEIHGCSSLGFKVKEYDMVGDPLFEVFKYTTSEAIEELGIQPEVLS
jgi:hypothetical protein